MGDPRRPVYLLDTHVWIWLMAGAEPLRSSPARLALQAATSPGALRISIISVWEVGMLEAGNRIGLPGGCESWIRQALAPPEIALAPLTPQIALASTRLPGKIHGDPADRIIAATARALGATLVTRDQRLLDYGAAGHLTTLGV